jgi:hypothetical protein
MGEAVITAYSVNRFGATLWSSSFPLQLDAHGFAPFLCVYEKYQLNCTRKEMKR